MVGSEVATNATGMHSTPLYLSNAIKELFAEQVSNTPLIHYGMSLFEFIFHWLATRSNDSY